MCEKETRNPLREAGVKGLVRPKGLEPLLLIRHFYGVLWDHMESPETVTLTAFEGCRYSMAYHRFVPLL